MQMEISKCDKIFNYLHLAVTAELCQSTGHDENQMWKIPQIPQARRSLWSSSELSVPGFTALSKTPAREEALRCANRPLL
jgi:hypothetical protein